MRKLLLLLMLACLSVSSLQAQRKIIIISPTHTERQNRWEEDDRSLEDSALYVTHEKNTFYLYSDMMMEDVKLTIRDDNNDIVSSIITTITPEQDIITIPNVISGSYIIEFEYKGEFYCGFFKY
jgi:hypothetical protein